jgi:hypothetical protein
VLQFHKNLVWIQSSTKVALRISAREEDEELRHSQNPNNILQTLRQARKTPRRVCVFFRQFRVFSMVVPQLHACLLWPFPTTFQGLSLRAKNVMRFLKTWGKLANPYSRACVLSDSFRVLSMVVHQLHACYCGLFRRRLKDLPSAQKPEIHCSNPNASSQNPTRVRLCAFLQFRVLSMVVSPLHACLLWPLASDRGSGFPLGSRLACLFTLGVSIVPSTSLSRFCLSFSLSFSLCTWMHGLSPPLCIVLVQQKPIQGCHCGWLTFGIGVGWCLSMQESCKGCQCSDPRHPFFDCNPAIHWYSCLHCNSSCSNLKLFPKCFDLCPWMMYALSFPCSLHLSNSCFFSLCFWTCGSVHIAKLELHTLKWLLCVVQCHVYLCWACWAC